MVDISDIVIDMQIGALLLNPEYIVRMNYLSAIVREAYGAQQIMGLLDAHTTEEDRPILYSLMRNYSICPERFRERLSYYMEPL